MDEAPPSRLRMAFIVQPEAVGTANAIVATRSWMGDESFLAMNSDNLYPVAALRDLAALDEPGLPAFELEDLIRSGNIPAERVRSFARIVEACRDVPRSARGEYELPEAVGLAVQRGVRFKAVPAKGPVLDLSRRADAADVERRLAGMVPAP